MKSLFGIMIFVLLAYLAIVGIGHIPFVLVHAQSVAPQGSCTDNANGSPVFVKSASHTFYGCSDGMWTQLIPPTNTLLSGLAPSLASGTGIIGANGQGFTFGQVTELTTIAAAATSATTIQIPANVIVLSVPVRVTVAIPTATTFTVTGTTDTGQAFQTGASVAVAIGTTDLGGKLCPYANAAAQTLTITPSTTPATAVGRVRVTVNYISTTPPTS